MSQNQQIQAALEEQGKQNSEFLKVYEVNLKNLHEKEFAVEKDKIVFSNYYLNILILAVLLKNKIEIEKQKSIDDLKKELTRQAAAHNNHLAQMLRIQEDELTSIHEKFY